MCCAALQQSAAHGSPEEEDLFITRGILQLLATGKANMLDDKLADAQDVLQSYDAMRPVPQTPLLNFIRMLIRVIHTLITVSYFAHGLWQHQQLMSLVSCLLHLL